MRHNFFTMNGDVSGKLNKANMPSSKCNSAYRFTWPVAFVAISRFGIEAEALGSIDLHCKLNVLVSFRKIISGSPFLLRGSKKGAQLHKAS